MVIMKGNQQLLVEELAGEDYCRFGDAAGALYATVLVKLEKLEGFANMIEFCKGLFA